MSRREELRKLIDEAEKELRVLDPVAHLSVREFAAEAGVSPATAHRFKQGKMMDVPTYRKLLKYLTECPCCGRDLS